MFGELAAMVYVLCFYVLCMFYKEERKNEGTVTLKFEFRTSSLSPPLQFIFFSPFFSTLLPAFSPITYLFLTFLTTQKFHFPPLLSFLPDLEKPKRNKVYLVSYIISNK